MPSNAVHPDKLTGLQLVKKFPEFYGNRRFITLFTSVRHLFLSRPRSIQPIPPQTLPQDPFYYYPTIYAWSSSGTFPQVSPPKPRTHLYCLPYEPHAPSISFFLVWSSAQHLARSTNHKALRYVIYNKLSVIFDSYASNGVSVASNSAVRKAGFLILLVTAN
jgi:hypothetical protein